MGFVRGSVTCTRFLVAGDLPDEFHEAARERIPRYAFRRLREDSDQERAVGWVNVLDELQIGFYNDEFFKEPYLALSFRVDSRSVPARTLRQYCREAEEEVKARDGIEYLNKKRREEIRDAVKGRLLRRAIPRSVTYDMAWDLQSGIVLFGSTSKRICDEFSETFYNTFELRLTSLYPYALAYGFLQEQGMDPGMLEHTQPTLTAVKEETA
ncbi:MAG: recombination-associated protein RdgC [Thermodesulfobacteriota bacterium]